MKLKAIYLFTFFALTFISCKSGADKKKSHMQERIALTSDSFKVEKINEMEVAGYDVEFTLDLRNNRISGNGGCNGFSASFNHNQDGVEIGMAMATKRYCEETKMVEKAFFSALGEVKNYYYNGKTIQLTSETGDVLIQAKKKTK